MENHLVATHWPCHVVSEGGVIPRVRHDRNYRIPDLVVTCSPPSNAPMVSDPVLIVEILSPSNEVETWANIWAYTTIPSVAEILIVSSTKIEAELLRRNADGTWPEDPEQISSAAALHLESLSFETPLAAFYRTTSLARG